MDGIAAVAHVQVRGVGRPEGGSLFSDLDAIDEVGGLSEAVRRQVPVFFIVKHQSFTHGLAEL
jgi:hypothetical protein